MVEQEALPMRRLQRAKPAPRQPSLPRAAVMAVGRASERVRYSVSGQIDAGILVNLSEVNINELMVSLKEKEFTNVRKWIVQNLDNDPVRIFRRVYDTMYDRIDSSSIPHAVLILADYSYKSSFVADQEINLLACMTELMGQCKFK